MAWAITDINKFEIEFDNGFNAVNLWKQNIFMVVNEPELTVYFDNRPQGTAKGQFVLDYRDVAGYGGSGITSAADLKVFIEDMMSSGWGGGGDVLFTKGDILTHDGSNQTIKPIGVDGRIAMADSTDPDGWLWQDPSALPSQDITGMVSRHYKTGTGSLEMWYSGLNAGLSAAGFGCTGNFMYFIPIFIGKDFTADRLAFFCSAFVLASNARLGIYSAANCLPETRIIDAGEISTATTGIKSITISQALTEGLYWLTLFTSHAITVRRITTATLLTPLGMTNTLEGMNPSLRMTGVAYGALPATLSASGGTFVNQDSLNQPLIGIRFS